MDKAQSLCWGGYSVRTPQDVTVGTLFVIACPSCRQGAQAHADSDGRATIAAHARTVR